MSFLLGDIFDNVFDDTYDNGEYDNISYLENNRGGVDIYDDNLLVGHSEDNIFDGEDYYNNDNQRILHTEDNGIGGLNIYSSDGYEGTLVNNDIGSDIFYGANGSIEHLNVEDFGNGSAIMQFDDPLAHISSYIMPNLIL